MTGWQDSRSSEQKHVHTTVVDSRGQNICTQCQQIVIEPILDSDDERLKGIGLLRSGDDYEESELFPMPLPELLIAMCVQLGAPEAPYVKAVLAEGNNRYDEDLWYAIACKF